MKQSNHQNQLNNLPIHCRLKQIYTACPFCGEQELIFSEDFFAFFNSDLHTVSCKCGFFAAYDKIGMEYIYGRKDKFNGIHCHSLLKTQNNLKPYGFSPFGLICLGCDYNKNCGSCGVSLLMTNYSTLTTILKNTRQAKEHCDFCQSTDTISQLRIISKNENDEHINIFKPLDFIRNSIYNRDAHIKQIAFLYNLCLDCNNSKTIELEFND